VAIGAEHLFGKVVVAVGLFTNVSAAPKLPATATEYAPDQVNIWGAAFSIGLDTKGYRFTVGANGYFGRGDSLAATLDRETVVVSYVRTKSTIGGVVVYIAGAISVATKGAKDVQGKVKKKKKKGDDGSELDEETTEHEDGSEIESEIESGNENGSENEPGNESEKSPADTN
jgi:hypothetical protein